MVKLEDLILLNIDWYFGSNLEIVAHVKSDESYLSEKCGVSEALDKYGNSKVLAFSSDRIVIEF